MADINDDLKFSDDDEDNGAQDTNEQGPSSSSLPTTTRPPDIEPKGNNPRGKPATISNSNLSIEPSKFPPINENIMKECEECHNDFLRSYLYKNFAVHVCDDCRDPKETHELITKTEAKTKYLLKDCDLDIREPTLRYILKKNPHQTRGDMRLYLKFQIEERALEVHGSEEQLEKELEEREERRFMKKQKTYDKKMKSLSMSVRSSLYKRSVTEHEHEYGEAICLDEDKDLYRKICKTCKHQWDYEEM